MGGRLFRIFRPALFFKPKRKEKERIGTSRALLELGCHSWVLCFLKGWWFLNLCIYVWFRSLVTAGTSFFFCCKGVFQCLFGAHQE